MKTVTYSITDVEVLTMKKEVHDHVSKAERAYHKHPERYVRQSLTNLKTLWAKNARAMALFSQFERDGLAKIEKVKDEFYTFSDHAGECYCPKVNSDIDPKALKRQERNERARFNRQGVYCMQLVVLGDDESCIGGLVGDDFYGSGYDTDFYTEACEIIQNKMPEYSAEIAEKFLDEMLVAEKSTELALKNGYF